MASSSTNRAKRLLQRRREQRTALPALSPGRGTSAGTNTSIDSIDRPRPSSPTMSSMSSVHAMAGPGPPSSPGRSRSKITVVSGRQQRLLPPTVSPGSPSRSWDEGDARPPSPGGGSWKAPKKKSIESVKQTYSLRKVKSSPTSESSSKSIWREDMTERPPASQASSAEMDESSVESSSRSQNSSIGDGSSNIRRLCQAIKQNSDRPTGLSNDERLLWEAVQMSKRAARHDAISEQMNTSNITDTSWEARLIEVQEKAMLQQRENSRSLEAIHQVLSKVQAERDHAVSQLQDFRMQSDDHLSSCGSSASLDSSRDAMQRDMRAMAARIVSLEKELQSRGTGEDASSSDMHGSIQEPHLDSEEHDKGFVDLKLKPSSDSVDTTASLMTHPSSVQFEATRRDLTEKTAALENAKMIIESLRNSNESKMAELRSEINKRDEELSRLQRDSVEKQKKLDKLATELRDIQRHKSLASGPTEVTEAERVKRLQLSSRLETNLADIRAAAVILESTQDASAVSNLAKLLTDSANALREGVEVMEHGASDDGQQPFRLWRELEEKKKAIKHLEEELTEQRENYHQLRSTMEKALQQRDEEKLSLQLEVKNLEQKCKTNMEVLAKKERELGVLRDSLRVEDDVGYISDDEDPEEEDERLSAASPSPTAGATMMLGADYGHSQAEALATILAHGGNHSFDSGSGHNVSEEKASKQLENAKAELTKLRSELERTKRELKVDKESLANAKLIISSLERNNKKMMEESRTRLQDSNSAIASLLEKSMESERANTRLRMELENARRSHERIDEVEEEETLLALPPAPEPLPLTETID